MSEQYTAKSDELKRTLGLMPAGAIVAGSMLGIGIFIIPPQLAAVADADWMFYFLWLVGGIVALAGADSFAELGAAYPSSGGDFSFQKRAFGPSVAFATGCVLYIGVFGGSIASVAVPIWEYQLSTLLGVDFRQAAFSFGSFSCSRAQLGAVLLVLVFTGVNSSRARNWARLQILLTAIPLLGLIVMAAYVLMVHPQATFQEPSIEVSGSYLSRVVTGYLGVYFAYSGWNSIIYLAGEVREPGQVLPRSLLGGTVLVTLLYLLLCWSFMHVLGLEGLAQTGEAGTAVATRVSPNHGGPVAGVLIALALLASLNASITGGARIAYAMAKDGVAWPGFARLRPKTNQPVTALWFQAFWVIVLIFSGTFIQLIQLTSIAMLVTGSLTVLALFRLRYVEPRRPRPYRSFCYPLLPLVYLLGSLGVIVYRCVDAATGGPDGYFPLLGILILFLAYISHRRWVHPAV